MSQEIKKEEWQEWLLHPVTKALREQFREAVERIQGEWARGAFEGKPELDAKVRGQLEILQQFLDLEVSDLESE